MRGRLRVLAFSLFASYLVGLLLAMAGMRLCGEQHWLTTTLLYLPRLSFVLPLPIVLLALALFGPRWLLWLTPIPVWLLLFPLMGLRLGLGSGHQAADRGGVRVLSYNTAGGPSPGAVADVVRQANADIVLLQEWKQALEPALAGLVIGFHQHRLGQFWIASRYPIQEVHVPALIRMPDGERRTARFVRYRVLAPFGLLHVLHVHPVSPREGWVEGIRRLQTNSLLRQRQAERIAAEAARSPIPVIIAGDTNLPGLSWIFGRTLAGFTDGFEAVGRGFGYTFPAHRPWMRIDRILTDGRLRFRSFQVTGNPQASDHLAVLAEIELP